MEVEPLSPLSRSCIILAVLHFTHASTLCQLATVKLMLNTLSEIVLSVNTLQTQPVISRRVAAELVYDRLSVTTCFS